MTMLAYDGASPFDLADAKAAGGILITGYIVGHPGGLDPIGKERVQQALALGLGVLPNWERAADYFLTCTVADAKTAGVEALTACRALGFADDGSVGVAFSFDVQVPASRFAEMGSKVDAITAGLAGHYLTVVYAQQSLIEYLVAHGHLTGKQWLMGSTWGQPYHPSSPNVFMVQSHDAAGNWLNSTVHGTDVNTVIDPHAIPAAWPTNSPYALEADMALDLKDPVIVAIRADIAALSTKVQALTQIEIWGDKTHPDSLTSIGADVAALQAALAQATAAIKAGGVDPTALAQAITAHIQLTAK